MSEQREHHLPTSKRSVVFWRRWHRWIGITSSIFLVWAAITGVLVAGTEFFGADEALREQLRTVTSPITVNTPDSAIADVIGRAMFAVAQQAPGAPVDKIVLQPKGTTPTVTIFTGKPGGGEDKQYVVNAKTAAVIGVESYEDKPFLYRLHSGEAFGDGGLVASMLWGLALALMGLTGLVIWWRIRRRNATGIKRVFW